MRYFRLALAAGILGMASITIGAPAFAQAGNEWTKYGGDYANTRYSTLDQINTRNVNKLKVAWIHSLGALETQESTPLIVGDTMYVTRSTGPATTTTRRGAAAWPPQISLRCAAPERLHIAATATAQCLHRRRFSCSQPA